MFEPYYYDDFAAQTVRIAQKSAETRWGEDWLTDKRWGVKKVPRPPRHTTG